MDYKQSYEEELERNAFLAERIAELEEEIEAYDSSYQRDLSKLRELQHNPKAIEKIARERYYMKNADEDIFVMREEEADEATTETEEAE